MDSLLVKFMEVNKERAEADLESRLREHKATNPVREHQDKLATIVIDLHKNGNTVTPSTTVIVDNKGMYSLKSHSNGYYYYYYGFYDSKSQ